MALCAVGVMWRKPCGWSWRRAVAVGYTPEVSQFDMIKKTIKNILHYFSIYRDFMMIDLSVLPDDLPYVYQIYMTFTHISPSYLSYLPGDNQLNSTIFTRFYQMFFSYLHIFTRYLYGFLPSIEGPWASFFRDKPRSERIRRPMSPERCRWRFRSRQLCLWRSVESVADVSMNGTLMGYIYI